MKKSSKKTISKNAYSLQWETQMPLVTNPFMIWLTLKVCLISGFIMAGLMTIIFATQGEWDVVVTMCFISAITAVGLWVFFMLIMLIFFVNKMPMEFTMDDKKIICQITSKVGKMGNRLAIIAGILGKNPGTTGAGMLGLSQETTVVNWKNLSHAKYYPSWRTIMLYNSWRQVLMLHSSPEEYEKIENFVKEKLTTQEKKTKSKNPVLHFLFRTILTIVACIPIFAWDDAFIEWDDFMPIFTLCFALATIWMIPLFGYVVMLSVLYFIGMILYQGLRIHEVKYSAEFSILNSNDTTGFGYLMDYEWINLFILLLGLTYLFVSSWRSVRGKTTSALLTH